VENLLVEKSCELQKQANKKKRKWWIKHEERYEKIQERNLRQFKTADKCYDIIEEPKKDGEVHINKESDVVLMIRSKYKVKTAKIRDSNQDCKGFQLSDRWLIYQKDKNRRFGALKWW